MTLIHFTLPALMALLLTATGAPALAQQPPEIGQLSFLDHQYMDTQRTRLEELARDHFGEGFSGERDSDLSLLQSLLDEDLVRADQTQELQAMGVVMGDLLAADLGMHWVVYEDRLGRSRALRYQDSDNYLFPVTMISRRREVGNSLPIRDIYQKAYDIIAPLRSKLPFQ
ncbi:MAG: DUF3806 domain-containing protein [Parahaliea sp.]